MKKKKKTSREQLFVTGADTPSTPLSESGENALSLVGKSPPKTRILCPSMEATTRRSKSSAGAAG